MITTIMACTVTGICCFSAGTLFGALWTRRAVADWQAQFDKIATIADAAINERDALQAWKDGVLGGLKKASAARKAKAQALTNVRHAEMRQIIGDII